jgi:hypothetical protein
MHNKTTLHKQKDFSGEEVRIHSLLARQMHCVQVVTSSRDSTHLSLIEVLFFFANFIWYFSFSHYKWASSQFGDLSRRKLLQNKNTTGIHILNSNSEVSEVAV